MKTFGQIVFWTVAAVLVIPAIVGGFAGAVVMALIVLVGLIALLAALALICLSCIPIIWWCGMWESINTQQWLQKAKKALKPQDN